MGTVAYFYSNNAVAGAVGNSGGLAIGGTSLYLAATPSGYPGSFPFKLRLDPRTASEEVVKVTGGAGTSISPWTIVRAWDGTTSHAHASGAGVEHGLSQEDLALSRQHEASDNHSATLPHGLPSAAWVSASLAAINETVISGTATAQVSFGSIPQSFSHLLLVVAGKSNDPAHPFISVNATVNGDSSANYSLMNWGTNAGSSTVGSAFLGGQSSWSLFRILGAAGISALHAGGGFALLPNYTGTTFDKMVVALGGGGTITGTNITNSVNQGWYSSATPVGITSFAVALASGTFVPGSFVGLYGVG